MLNNSKIKTILNIKNDRKFRIVCESNLQRIGCGTTRNVYKLNDKLVLKVANRKYGYTQNVSECNTFYKHKNLNVFVEIIDKAENYLWLIQPIATPLDEKDEKFKQIVDLVTHIEESKHYISNEDFLNNLYDFLKDVNINYLHDFKKCDSYGKIDGKVYVIDYAMNNEMFDYYKK